MGKSKEEHLSDLLIYEPQFAFVTKEERDRFIEIVKEECFEADVSEVQTPMHYYYVAKVKDANIVPMQFDWLNKAYLYGKEEAFKNLNNHGTRIIRLRQGRSHHNR